MLLQGLSETSFSTFLSLRHVGLITLMCLQSLKLLSNSDAPCSSSSASSWAHCGSDHGCGFCFPPSFHNRFFKLNQTCLHVSLSTRSLSSVLKCCWMFHLQALPQNWLLQTVFPQRSWEVLACGPELEPEMIITPYCLCQAVLLSHLPIQLPRTKEEGC